MIRHNSKNKMDNTIKELYNKFESLNFSSYPFDEIVQNCSVSIVEDSNKSSFFKTSPLNVSRFESGSSFSVDNKSERLHIKERDIEYDGYLPGKLSNSATKFILNRINEDLVKEWRLNIGVDVFDIDVKLKFRKDIEEGGNEAIYTVYVPNLTKENIPLVWNNLRKFYNKVIENNKNKYRKYRNEIEKLHKISYIQLDRDW